MPKFVVKREGAPFALLADALDRASKLVLHEEVNLNELGKALAEVVTLAREVFVVSKLPSMRLDAAARALDLRTPKSALERFLDSPP